MATLPLDAASIFGAPLILNPQGLAAWQQRQAMQGAPQPAVVPVPVPVPVPAKGKKKAAPAAPGSWFGPEPLTPFNWWEAGQDPNEFDAVYGVRRAVGAPIRAVDAFVNDVSAGIRRGFDTPAARVERARAAQANQPQSPQGGAFPQSFMDPAYDAVEAQVARQYGGPYAQTLAGLLHNIRTQGERTNAGVQNARTGANTPYQITSKTRAGIQKNYGFDPWASPENAARGAAMVLLEQAGAFRKGGVNLNDPAIQARAVGGYFGGAAGAANPFGGLSDGISTAGQYTQRVLGPNTGLPAPFVNPYDPRFDQAALGMIGAERKALMTPFETSMNVGPAPEMPKPEPLPTTDFSASDAALEQLRPIEMSEKERMQRERDGFWKGISQALMSTTGNEGIGTFLAHLGGAALGGRMQARDEIRREQDKFDEKMAKFHAAVFQNELGKAETHQREAAAIVQQNNEYNQNNWKMAYQRWLGSASIDISGTNAVIQQRDDKTGTLSVRTIPIQGAVDAAIAQQSAQLFQHMGGMQMSGNQQVASMTNSIVGRAAIAAMSGGADSSTADGAAAAAPAFYGTFIARNGLTSDLLGADAAASLEKSVTDRLIQMKLVPGSAEWVDRHDRLVATELAKGGLASPDMMQRMVQVGGAASSFEALNTRRSSTRSTDAQGRVTTRETSQLNAADIFDN